MHPTHGARLQLRLRAQHDDHVSYDVQLFDPQRSWEGRARVRLADGDIELGSWREPGAPPDWMSKMTSAFLKQKWRARQKPASPAWPRKLTRWRAAPAS